MEHYENADAQAAPTTPVELRLADHLPSARTFDLTALSVDFGAQFTTAFELLTPGSWVLPEQLPTKNLQTEAVHLGFGFRGLGLLDPQPIHVYTDGSFDGSCSSWAFVVVSPLSPQPCLLGWAGNRVVTDPDHPSYIGAERHSAVAGEQCALIWAIIWALQTPRQLELLPFL